MKHKHLKTHRNKKGILNGMLFGAWARRVAKSKTAQGLLDKIKSHPTIGITRGHDEITDLKMFKAYLYKNSELGLSTLTNLQYIMKRRSLLAEELDIYKSTDSEYDTILEVIDRLNDDIKLLLNL